MIFIKQIRNIVLEAKYNHYGRLINYRIRTSDMNDSGQWHEVTRWTPKLDKIGLAYYQSELSKEWTLLF